MCDYFHLLIHSRVNWVSYGICINPSCTKALSGPSCNYYKTGLPDSLRTRSSLYVFLLQIKSVALLFSSSCCSPGWYRYLCKTSSGSIFSSKVASFGFINDFVLCIVLTRLFRWPKLLILSQVLEAL